MYMTRKISHRAHKIYVIMYKNLDIRFYKISEKNLSKINIFICLLIHFS